MLSNALDDPAAALRSARLARLVLEEQSERTEVADPLLDELRVEALRAEGVTLHNLQLDRMALERYRFGDLPGCLAS